MGLYANLEFDKARRRNTTHKQRKTFCIRLKKALQELPEPQFMALCREHLHHRHFPALEDYIYYSDLAVSDLKKAEKNRAEYMTKMFRKTLTAILVDLEDGSSGYTPFILEWLVINNYWN